MSSPTPKFGGLCLTLCLSTLAFDLTGHPGLTADFPFQTTLFGGVVAVTAGTILVDRASTPPAFQAVVGLLLWSVISAFQSIDRNLSLQQLLNLTSASGILILMALSTNTDARRRRAAWSLFAIALASSTWAWIADHYNQAHLRLSGNWTNPDTFALIPLGGFFLSGMLSTQRGAARWLTGLSAGLFAATLVKTWSRSSWIGLALGLLVVIQRNRARRSNRLNESLKVVSAGLIGLLVLLIQSGGLLNLKARLGSTFRNPFDVPLRLEVAGGSLKASASYLPFGSGPGTFCLAFQKFRSADTPTPEYMNSAHNDFLQLLVEIGPLGALLWLAILYQGWMAVSSSQNKDLSPQNAWLEAGCVAFFTFSIFNFASPVPASLAWWWALQGLCIGGSAQTCRGKGPYSSSIPIAAVLAAFGTLTVVFSAFGFLAQRHSLEAEKLLEKGAIQEALTAVSQSIRLSPYEVTFRLQRAKLCEQLAHSDPRWRQQAKHDIERAQHLSPYDLKVLFAHYNLALEEQDWERLFAVVQRGLKAAPQDRRFRRYQAGLQAREGLYGEAAANLIGMGEPWPSELPVILYAEFVRAPENFAIQIRQLQDSPDFEKLIKSVIKVSVDTKDYRAVSELYRWLLAQPQVDPAAVYLLWSIDSAALGKTEESAKLAQEALTRTSFRQDLYLEILSRNAFPLDSTIISKLLERVRNRPSDIRARTVLAGLLSPDKAIDLLTEGLALNPNDPQLLNGMRLAFQRAGVSQVASDYQARAIKAGYTDRPSSLRIKLFKTNNVRSSN